MAIFAIVFLVVFSPIVLSYNDDSINLLVRSSAAVPPPLIIRRYCVDLAKLPDGHTINITNFAWHNPYVALKSVNACNLTDLQQSLPHSFPLRTILILTEHQCKMTEHAWNVEKQFGKQMSLMVITNRTNVQYELTWNSSAMPVSIPVLIFWQKDFDRMNKFYANNISNIQLSIDYPLNLPKKFRPAIFLMFALVFVILLAGNSWAADEFRRKITNRDLNTQGDSPNLNTSSQSTHLQDSLPLHQDGPTNSPIVNADENVARKNSVDNTSKNAEPAVLPVSYCLIALILFFAVGWLLLIYYFPKVMIYILQGMFCIGAFSSLTSCFVRMSYFLPILRRYRIPSHTFRRPCTCQLGPLNVITLFALILSLTLVVLWYVYRQADWAWILQDILGAAICITVTSVYRLGNMRVITLILLGFFLYDIFFVFITPYIAFFQPSNSNSSAGGLTTTMMMTTTTTMTKAPSIRLSDLSNTSIIKTFRRVSKSPSVMEQVALGFGTNGEVVPLLFAVPMFISDSETDPCIGMRKSMLGFGDVILPGILLTFCKLFDIASANRWPIYYVQSVVAYFIGLTLTHVALYLMNTAQPALLYLVPCILLSTIITGLCRRELKELYTGRRIKLLLDRQDTNRSPALLADVDHSNGEPTIPSAGVAVEIKDEIGAVASGLCDVQNH